MKLDTLNFPSYNQIKNWLCYERKINFSTHLEALDNFVLSSKTCIFPNRKKNFPTNYFKKGKMIIVLKFGQVMFAKFMHLVNNKIKLRLA